MGNPEELNLSSASLRRRDPTERRGAAAFPDLKGSGLVPSAVEDLERLRRDVELCPEHQYRTLIRISEVSQTSVARFPSPVDAIRDKTSS
jgi:hypothetical protein